MMLTPSLIWKDFETANDLNVSIIREYDEDNIIHREVYFSARNMCDGVTRVYGHFACPKEIKKHAAVLYCPNVGRTVDERVVKEIARRGYAVLGFDYSGETADSARFTIYPKSLDYANYSRSGRHLTHCDGDATETCWYEWTVVARYAVKFLTEQPEVDADKIGVIGVRSGGYFAYQLASFCKDVKAGVSIFEGGWTEYAGKFKHGDDNEIKVDEEREKWMAGVATQVYAKHVKTPFLYLGATNDSLGNCDRVGDTLLRMENGSCYCAFAPNLCNFITEDMQTTLYRFFDKYVCGKDVEFEKGPSITLALRERSIVCYVSADVAPEVYISFNEVNSVLRYWQKLTPMPCQKVEGEKTYHYALTIPVFEGATLVSALAACRYPSGVFLTSLVTSMKLASRDIDRIPCEHNRMIFGSQPKAHDFTITTDVNLRDGDCVTYNDSTVIEEGAFQVSGVTAKAYHLATFKMNDMRYAGIGSSVLKFDIYSKSGGKMKIVAYSGYLTEQQESYTAHVEIIGGELWQKTEISLDSLKTENGISLPAWDKSDCLVFESENKFLLTNMLWL